MPLSDQGMPQKTRYLFIPRVLIFLEQDDKVLLLKGAADKPIWPNLYNGLGGHVERGESILEAAKREVLEESGLRAPDLWLCAVVSIDTDEDKGIVMWVFRGMAPTQELHDSREGNLEWIKLAEIDDYSLVPDIPILLAKIFARNPETPLLWGHYWYDQNDIFQYSFSK